MENRYLDLLVHADILVLFHPVLHDFLGLRIFTADEDFDQTAVFRGIGMCRNSIEFLWSQAMDLVDIRLGVLPYVAGDAATAS